MYYVQFFVLILPDPLRMSCCWSMERARARCTYVHIYGCVYVKAIVPMEWDSLRQLHIHDNTALLPTCKETKKIIDITPVRLIAFAYWQLKVYQSKLQTCSWLHTYWCAYIICSILTRMNLLWSWPTMINELLFMYLIYIPIENRTKQVSGCVMYVLVCYSK